jgi:hypothetical protein
MIACMVLFASSSASASGGWKGVSVERQQGKVDATLSYQARPSPLGFDYRRMRLVVHRAGAPVIDWLFQAGEAREVSLTLRNVWGDRQPEALVDVDTGGQICCVNLTVGLTGSGTGAARVLMQGGFPFGGWDGQWHRGTFDFVSTDYRFFCAFTSCAGTPTPIQIFAIDPAGVRFVDVTRSRPDLIKTDALSLWQEYLRGKGPPDKFDAVLGVLAPWCADQYLLGQEDRCHRVLDQALAHGYLNGWFSGDVGTAKGGRAAINLLYKTLASWGYSRP